MRLGRGRGVGWRVNVNTVLLITDRGWRNVTPVLLITDQGDVMYHQVRRTVLVLVAATFSPAGERETDCVPQSPPTSDWVNTSSSVLTTSSCFTLTHSLACCYMTKCQSCEIFHFSWGEANFGSYLELQVQ